MTAATVVAPPVTLSPVRNLDAELAELTAERDALATYVTVIESAPTGTLLSVARANARQAQLLGAALGCADG